MNKLDFILETDEERVKKKENIRNKEIEEIKRGIAEGRIKDPRTSTEWSAEEFRRQYLGNPPIAPGSVIPLATSTIDTSLRISNNTGADQLIIDSERVLLQRPNGPMSLEQALRRVEEHLQSIENMGEEEPIRERFTAPRPSTYDDRIEDILREYSLARQLGEQRTPEIREAYRRLQAEGLMNSVPVAPETMERRLLTPNEIAAEIRRLENNTGDASNE